MSTYLGQNFLTHTPTIRFIVDRVRSCYEADQCEAIIEIGPGKGAITKGLLTITDKLTVIEKDTRMVEILQDTFPAHETPNLTITNQDILEWDPAMFFETTKIHPAKTLIVGNLPYYITSPIVRKFFGQAQSHYAGGMFMMQKEVGEKIMHTAPKKSYGWWLANFAHEVQYAKTVPAKAFNPPPKVQSCLLWFSPKQTQVNSNMYDHILRFLDIISPYKRKTLGKISKMLNKRFPLHQPIVRPETLTSKRIEELSWEDMATLLDLSKQLMQ